MSRYACWLEPAVVVAWRDLIVNYNPGADIGDLIDAFAWGDPQRSTAEVRGLIKDRLASAQPVQCVWTGRKLRSQFEVDHCFPYANWPNNDLWNLLPASKQANQSKSARLPSSALLESARIRILSWWETYLADESRRERFIKEAMASLPGISNNPELDDVFTGLHRQRSCLRLDQQIPEWFAGTTMKSVR
jgi:hypothetical protein